MKNRFEFTLPAISGLLTLGTGLIILIFYALARFGGLDSFTQLAGLEPYTPLSFALLGLWIFLYKSGQSNPSCRISNCAIPFIILLISVFELPGLLVNYSSINDLFVKGGIQTNPFIAVNLALASLAIIARNHFKSTYLYQGLVILSVYFGLIYLEGFLLHVWFVPETGINYLSHFLNIVFLVTAFSLLFISRKEGFLKLFFEKAIGGTAARKVIPLIILLPFLTGYLRMEGVNSGLFDEEDGVVIMVAGLTLIFAIQLFFSSFQLNKVDQSRNKIKEDLLDKSRELERSEFLLKESGKLARVGGWEVFLPEKNFTGTKEVLAIRELQEGTHLTFEEALNFYTTDSKSLFIKSFDQSLIDGHRYTLELKLITATGREIWVRVIGQPVKNTEGVVSSVRGIIQDINDSKQKEILLQEALKRIKNAREEVKQKEELYQTLVNQGSDMLAILDQEARYTMASPNYLKIMGYKPEDLLGVNGFELMHPEDAIVVQGTFQKLLETKENQTAEFRYKKANGEWIWMEGVASYHLDNPSIQGIAISSRDTTERVEREQELKRNKVLYKALFENNPDLVCYQDKDGYIQDINQAGADLHHKPVNQLVNRHYSTYLNADNSEISENALNEAFEGTASQYEQKIIIENGEVVHLDITKIPVIVEEEVIGVHTIAKNITQQRMFLETIQTQSEDLQSLNEELMAQSEELQSQSARLHLLNIELQDQKEQEHEAREKAETAERNAEEANKAKSIFLATMSHEIRTPMNGVMGMSALLAETSLNTEQQDYVNMISSSGEALLGVINDILDFSKIESGKMEIEQSDFDVKRCVQDVLRLFTAMASEKGIRLNYEIDRHLPHMLIGDSLRIRQVLINLINNALKFTPKGEIFLKVEIVESKDDQIKLLFSVRDTGIGIPADKLARLFKAFSQVDSSTTRKYGGSGLGLAICERLVNLMGGVIEVESQPGSGSTFSFTIQSELSTNVAASSAKQSEAQDSIFSEDFAAEYPLSILLAEDNLINQKLAVRILNKLGYQPKVVNNGLEVLEQLGEHPYDLILMDLLMPEMDGFAATREIRLQQQHQPHIVAMTASAFREDQEECFNAGMNGYISKPFQIEEFKTVLREASRNTSLQQV